MLVDPKYSRWPGCRHFPARFLGPKAPVHHSVQVKGKGDHAEGRLGVDIILVERQQPDYDTARYAGMAFLRAKAELYRDQDTKTDWIFLTQEDFKTRCRSITTAEGRALDDGYILGSVVNLRISVSKPLFPSFRRKRETRIR